jgi:aspartate 1-decarboxylase
MQEILLKSKIHRAKVTDANLNYEGSVTIDRSLMDLATLKEYEKVSIVNINNGERFETYVIEGPANTGTICLNGAAARLVQPGDLVIIMAYVHLDSNEQENYKPKLIMVDESNHPISQ